MSAVEPERNPRNEESEHRQEVKVRGASADESLIVRDEIV